MNNVQIPKIIHYCWFGDRQLSEIEKKCIESWVTYCPDYEIKRWNESNFDISQSQYCQEAYDDKKWAFVSDYARFSILCNYGGIYLDTDVELIKSLDDIVSTGAFMACEGTTNALTGEITYAIAPGLGMAAEKGNPVFAKILDYYNNIPFKGNLNRKTIVEHVTDYFEPRGFIKTDNIQIIDGITIYPPEYFCPLNNMTGEIKITDNTCSIHYYNGSWMNDSAKKSIEISRKFANKSPIAKKTGAIMAIPYRLANRIQTNGVKQTLLHLLKKD